jgi:coenzyme F420-0:L-glutamate ligase/coenzyme F420-1:gamma-L-glutamate ligase
VTLEILAVQGIPEVSPGADLAALIAAHAPLLRDGDVLVVTSKIVSKAEGQLRDVDREQAIDDETVRVVATRGETRIVQTRHGFVMAAAGVDASNVTKGEVVVLPVDADVSAHRIRDGVRELLGVNVGVVISDTFGRPWRVGVTDVAVGLAGLLAFDDLRGTVDPYGNELRVTLTCTVDEIAAAADLVKGKLNGVPVAIVRGLTVVLAAEDPATQGISDVVRSADDDMFSLGTRDVLPARTDAVSFAPGAVDAARVGRAIATSTLAGRPHEGAPVQFAVTSELPDVDLPANTAVVIVPYLVEPPVPHDLLAAGAAIENVLVALAIEQLGSRWSWPPEPVAGALLSHVGHDVDLPAGAIGLGLIAVGRVLPSGSALAAES